MQAQPMTDGAVAAAGERDMTPAPDIGDTVIVDLGSRHLLGDRLHPAIVTRVWSDLCINVCMLPDADATAHISSLQHASKVGTPHAFEQARPPSWRWRWEDAVV